MGNCLPKLGFSITRNLKIVVVLKEHQLQLDPTFDTDFFKFVKEIKMLHYS